ncbi:uncharacterized protein LOC132034629 [Lycium ferocissimum]|uniref:uncharacterized protein LOC132034629 n=1 Tax=Lycium ferocissimum TaxID=112874 RepID=UPI002815812E|nr:uncharacterized protein LOC132034629 [Lycium ferocissimum]
MVADMEDRVHRFVTGLGPHLIKDCMMASLQGGMDIARIQAYAPNLEDLEHNSELRKTRIGAVISGPDPQRQRYDRPTYSGSSQSLRTPVPFYKGESSQARPPLPRCDQCGKGHFGRCCQGMGVRYSCGQPGHVMGNCPSRGRGGPAQPTGSIAGSSSSVRPPGQGSNSAQAGRGRGRGQTSRSGSNPNRIYALIG